MMTSSFSWQWDRVEEPLATSRRATLIFSPCATVRRYSSVTASGCIKFQSYTCIGLPLLSSIGAASDKLGGRLRRFLRSSIPCNPHRVQERHKLAQASAHLLDGMSLLALACGVEPRTSRFVLRDPLARVFSALNFA